MANQNVSAVIPLKTETSMYRRQLGWRRHRTAYLFILPYALMMLVFGIGPGLYALLVSFADFKSAVPQYFAALHW